MCTLDSAQLHHTCILGVSVDMIAGMNTFNVSHVFHIKKSAQLYIEEIQEKVEINKCV